MRIDKYLKVSRLIKRRTISAQACDAGRVSVNGKVVKSSYNIQINDIIEITFGQSKVKVQVLDIKDTSKKEEAEGLF